MDPERHELDQLIGFAARSARDYLATLDERLVRGPAVTEALAALDEPLPEDGLGAGDTLELLVERGFEAAVHSAGPRFFHFVIGGVTPAALAADWLAATIDQNLGLWTASPLGNHLERLALGWLRDLFGLPQGWSGVLTTGATMANHVGLACARRWVGERKGVDVDEDGLAALGRIPVFSSGYLHASNVRVLGMLGIGRGQVRRLARDRRGALDLDALAAELEALGGEPAIVIANAGEVNAGDFDPIADMADLAARHGAWLHVDGAFGLFAAVSPATRHLVAGVERAHSVISDGHKWLNVPYDCGFAFVHDHDLLARTFKMGAAYLEQAGVEQPSYGLLGSDSSRRARSLPVWATLRAYGRAGVRAMVERHLELAQHVAALVDEAADLERLADVPLNIVCFRYHPPGIDDEDELNEINRALGQAILDDGRVFVGTTLFEGRVAFRPAIVNWRTKKGDVELLVQTVRALGERVTRARAAQP